MDFRNTVSRFGIHDNILSVCSNKFGKSDLRISPNLQNHNKLGLAALEEITFQEVVVSYYGGDAFSGCFIRKTTLLSLSHKE